MSAASFAAMFFAGKISGASIPDVTKTFLGTFNDETDATSYTQTSASLSTAGSNRSIIVAVMSRVSSGTGTTPSSVTVNGVSASMATSFQAASDRNSASIWIASVPTGTTGDIVVTYGSTQQRVGFGWWAAYDIQSTTPTATNGTDVSGASLDVNMSAGGVIFGCAVAGSTAATTFTWTGLVEDYDSAVGSGNGWQSGASYVNSAAQTPLAITCTGSGTPGGDQYCVAAFR